MPEVERTSDDTGRRMALPDPTASGSSAGYQTEEPGKKHGSQEGDQNAVYQAAGRAEADQMKEKAADNCTENTDDNIAEGSVAAAFHHFAC